VAAMYRYEKREYCSEIRGNVKFLTIADRRPGLAQGGVLEITRIGGRDLVR